MEVPRQTEADRVHEKVAAGAQVGAEVEAVVKVAAVAEATVEAEAAVAHAHRGVEVKHKTGAAVAHAHREVEAEVPHRMVQALEVVQHRNKCIRALWCQERNAFSIRLLSTLLQSG